MDNGKIPINKKYELEYRYHDKDADFKYFNRKFEVYLLEKKALRPQYIMHMDNSDIRHMAPGVYKASQNACPTNRCTMSTSEVARVINCPVCARS